MAHAEEQNMSAAQSPGTDPKDHSGIVLYGWRILGLGRLCEQVRADPEGYGQSLGGSFTARCGKRRTIGKRIFIGVQVGTIEAFRM